MIILTSIVLIICFSSVVGPGVGYSAEKPNNLALQRPVVASSAAWSKAEEAVDGNEYQGSRWTSNFPLDGNRNHTQWIYVELREPVEIDKARILWQRQRWAKDYRIQISDDTKNWQDVYSVVDVDAQQWRHQIEFEPVKARYVRLLCTRTAESQRNRKGLSKHINMYSVIEFEIYATGVDYDPLRFSSPASGKPVVASHSEDNMYRRPWQINDALMTTFWSVRKEVARPWIYIDLEDDHAVRSIELYWHRLPASYTIEVSQNAQQWQSVAVTSDFTVQKINDEEVKEVHILEFAQPVRARFIKVAIQGPPKKTEHTSIILQEFLIHHN